jgi:tetratricopeptide (TPR) repeat protein
MVSLDRPNREFALHPLDADIAYSSLPDSGPFNRQVLERRVAAWYEHVSTPPPWHSLTDVAAQRMAFEHRLRAADYDTCAFILDDIAEFLALGGSSRAVASMHFAIDGHLTDDAAVLADLVSFGLARHVGGPYQEAVEPLWRAIELAEQLNDLPHLGRALFSLGDTLRFLRRMSEAIGILTRAAEVASQLGDIEHQAHALLCLSLSHTYLGDGAEAMATAERIVRLADESKDPTVRGRAGDALSLVHAAAGRWDLAFQAGGQALSAYKEAGNAEALGYAGNVRGISLIAVDKPAQAIAELEQARTDSVRAETPRAEGLCLYNLAWAHWVIDDYGAAATAASAAIDAFRRAGGADIDASEHLAAAAGAMASGQTATARAELSAAADAARGNSDLVPVEWLLSAAAKLA